SPRRSDRESAELLSDRLQGPRGLYGTRVLGGRQDAALRDGAEHAQSGVARLDRSHAYEVAESAQRRAIYDPGPVKAARNRVSPSRKSYSARASERSHRMV